MAMRNRLVGDVLHHLEVDAVVDLVHPGHVVEDVAIGAALEDDDFQRGAGCDLLGYQESGPAAAGDDDVDGLTRLHLRVL